jgi:hypothetical protein
MSAEYCLRGNSHPIIDEGLAAYNPIYAWEADKEYSFSA